MSRRIRGNESVGLVHLETAVPAIEVIETVEVPVLDLHTVWINGDEALFADVVAPFALYQAKYATVGTVATFHIYDELRKMGVLTAESDDDLKRLWNHEESGMLLESFGEESRRNHQIGEAVMHGLIETWEGTVKVTATSSSTAAAEIVSDMMFHGSLYPEFLLLGEEGKQTEMQWQSYNVQNTNKFPKHLEVVFVTNAVRMVLNFAPGQCLTVESTDVTIDGEPIPDTVVNHHSYQELLSKVKAVVVVRFRFT